MPSKDGSSPRSRSRIRPLQPLLAIPPAPRANNSTGISAGNRTARRAFSDPTTPSPSGTQPRPAAAPATAALSQIRPGQTTPACIPPTTAAAPTTATAKATAAGATHNRPHHPRHRHHSAPAPVGPPLLLVATDAHGNDLLSVFSVSSPSVSPSPSPSSSSSSSSLSFSPPLSMSGSFSMTSAFASEFSVRRRASSTSSAAGAGRLVDRGREKDE